ncbi:MAG: hypothetical protein HZC43_12750 [Nitrosomonadales bacterium]|nr:hypothetical protein [Nitrosomonadales bacterium]
MNLFWLNFPPLAAPKHPCCFSCKPDTLNCGIQAHSLRGRGGQLPFSQPLIVFRWGNVNTTATILKFLQIGAAPVIAWPDLDAAGLLNASNLPRLAGNIGPENPQECLSLHGRDDPYLGQLRELDALRLRGESIALEGSIRKSRKRLDQERMISAAIPLILWTT